MKERADVAARSRGANIFVAVVLVLGLVIGAGSAVWIKDTFFTLPFTGTKSDTTHSQLIQSITREEQIVLVSLGIQGISTKKESSVLFGADIPWSERTLFLQYNFSAKLGIDGKDVEFELRGENDLRVFIPKFIFIGHDNEEFKLVAENNGFLSFVTPGIDRVEMINKILSSDTQEEYVSANEEILKDQVKAFYTSLIMSIDPNLEVEFEFAN